MRDDQVRRYARHILLPEIGGIGQRRLLDAEVSVTVGTGRHAANTAIAYLSAAGVGRLVLTGPGCADRVAAADVSGGLLLEIDDIGLALSDAIAARVVALNPDVTLTIGLDPIPDAHLDLSPGVTSVAAALEEACGAVVPLLFRLAVTDSSARAL